MQAGPQNQPRRGADGRRCWGEHWEEHAVIFGTGQPKKKEKQKAQKKGKAVQNFCCDLAGQMRFSLPWAPKSWDKGRSFKCVLAKKKPPVLSEQPCPSPGRLSIPAGRQDACAAATRTPRRHQTRLGAGSTAAHQAVGGAGRRRFPGWGRSRADCRQRASGGIHDGPTVPVFATQPGSKR